MFKGDAVCLKMKQNRTWRKHKKTVRKTYFELTGKVFHKSFNAKERMAQYYCAHRVHDYEWATRMDWK